LIITPFTPQLISPYFFLIIAFYYIFNKGLNNFSKIKLAKRLKKACFAYLTIFVKIIVAIFIDIR